VRALARMMVVSLSLFTANAVAEGAVAVSIDPKSSVIVPVNGTRQFTAQVTGATNTAVTWSLTAPAGSKLSPIGRIDGTGKYTAPSSPLPDFASATVTASSVAQPTARASTTVTVSYPVPSVRSLAPTSLALGAFSLTVNGSGFVDGARVLWKGSPLATKLASPSQLIATGTATELGPAGIAVAFAGPGAVSAALPVNVTSTVSVTVAPSSASLTPGATKQFQATVNGSANKAVNGATLARWFGATDAQLNGIFPQLVTFPIRDLGFMA
jgi:hypothetical protein